jgi:hypothetical protein
MTTKADSTVMIVADARMGSVMPPKMGFKNIPSDVLEHIFGYVDIRNLYSKISVLSKYFHYLMMRNTSLYSRLRVLNKFQLCPYKSTTQCDLYHPREFFTYASNALTHSVKSFRIVSFLMDLLFYIRDSPFYIGGSFATIMAHMFQGREIDLSLFSDSDIDIYCIGNYSNRSLLEYQNKLLLLVKRHFGDFDHFMTIKRYIINITVPDKKIQIVLHTKKSIDEHMEFVDLPITQFLLGSDGKSICLYKTRMAQFAMDSKINIISDPINEQTYNRISKYLKRGYQTFVHAQGQGYRMGHPMSRIVSIFEKYVDHNYHYGGRYTPIHRHYVDCSFKDLMDSLEIVKSRDLMARIPMLPNRHNNSVTSSRRMVRRNLVVNNNMVPSPLFRVLMHNQTIVCTQTESVKSRTAERRTAISHSRRHANRRRRYYDGYYSYSDDDDDYDYELIVEHYTEITILKKTDFKSEKLQLYRYKHDESADTFNSCERSNSRFKYILDHESTYPRQYPFFVPLTVSDMPSINKPLFFNKYCSYFLNNHGLAVDKTGTFDLRMFCQDERKVSIGTVDRIFSPNKFEAKQEPDAIELDMDDYERRDEVFHKSRRAHKIGRDKLQKSRDRFLAEQLERSKGLYGKKSAKSPKSGR